MDVARDPKMLLGSIAWTVRGTLSAYHNSVPGTLQVLAYFTLH